MKTYTCPAPAKINLFLHICNQRDDGYHELQTLFQFVELADQLTFTLNATGNITLSGDLSGTQVQDNLIFRAAMALKPYAVDEAGIEIFIEKNIPSGAGLGGGSSDAATTLLMLNQLWQLNLSLNELAKIGLGLGADVPIFIHGHAAFAEGVGETLLNVSTDTNAILLAMPKNCAISTAKIFSHPNLPRNTAKIDFKDYQFSQTHNDCQAIVKDLYPQVANTLRWLVEYAPSRMTGTGACCFALLPDINSAKALASQSPNFVDCYVTKTSNVSSAHTFIAETFTA
ncbi:4-(cytidine 5'-diphospho)-2-C-methyl-D-erythritol kinase [Saccharobesus litoralis]|uniref:4-diphosphocytidyl-2-C-methyl-D-erythritol kinase n=1 Tax=Saccharobesus litoralis TaxID=2172099 RepID=A0A2S0VU46_9ALTE|nr:4-(cytidine 5'-diphospho)-2-C-methyl-D-erythritol kinase [Saccharobesus litoralis]AWB67703.1 4-(cytidine 5'-diphospho)-2-C-methyl-D-erythritol kinase [Saccharobesus litoralis]